jgi:ATP-dependent protease ClpP protease subunit
MKKPLLLYAPIFDFTAQEFVEKMNEIPPEQDIEIWMNSPGGSVFAGWSIIGPLQKRTGNTKVCVFGNASSMAFYLMLYADEVEALEVTKFLLHRASGYVANPDDQAMLDSVNADLRKQLESRVDVKKMEEVCGCTMDDIFTGKDIKDLWITAKQAKKIGLIDSIKRMTPEEMKSYNSHFVAFADFSQGSEGPQGSGKQPTDINNQKPKIMTREEIQAQHPAVYAAILKDGRDEGVKAERGRVGSFLPFMDCDKDNVIKAIKEGTEFDNSVMAEMMVKLSAHTTKGNIEKDKPETIATGKVVDPKSPEAKKVEDFETEVKKGVSNIKTF